MSGNQKTVLIDGHNLGMEKGTGVATYARNLSYELHELGHKVAVLYGNRGSLNKDDLLREISFFDGSVEQPRFFEMIGQLRAALRLPFSYRAKQIPMSGRVISRTFSARLPYFDAVYNSTEVFKNAQNAFWLRQHLKNIRMPDAPDLAHWTYPLPVRIDTCPNIYTMHDLVPLRLPYTTLDHKKHYLRMVRLIGRRADHIVTVSENSKQDLIDLLGIPEEKITNTYQSVQIPAKYRDKPDSQVAREIEGVTGFEYKNYFLFWGSLEPKKNIGRMIEAYMASQIATPLVIVGAQAWKVEKELALLNEGPPSNDGAQQPNMSHLFERRRGARKRIIRLDYVPFSMLVSLIRGAKAALFPSLYEGFGLPALEAMLLGTPVICSNTSSLPEVAGDAARMVDPYDVATITTAIRELDADADLRADLIARGLKQAGRYSPENYRDRLQSVYARFL